MGGCVKCLKVFVNLSAIVFLLLGILQIVSGIVQLNKDTDIWAYTDWNFNSSYGWGMIIAGVVLFVIAVCGFVGAKKQSACCLAIFNLGMIILFLSFGIIYLVAKGTRNTFLETVLASDACTEVDWMRSYATIYATGKSVYGANTDCTMYVKNPDDWPADTFEKLEHSADSEGAYAAVTGCPAMDGENSNDTNFAKVIEEQLDCSGACDPYAYYIFSDINNGEPDDSCQNNLGNFIDKYAQLVEWTTGITALWLLVTIISGCALCCTHKKDPENIGQSYYAMQHGAYSYK